MMTRILCLIAMLLALMACRNTANKTIVESDPAHSSENALDWAGTYRGTLPCDGCEGIQTELHLNENNTYRLARRYLGRSDTFQRHSGSFTWNEAGSQVSLQGLAEDFSFQRFLVGENYLLQLDREGEPFTGEFAEAHRLTKATPGLLEKYWKLTELGDEPIVFQEGQQREAHLILRFEGDRVNGHAGCNRFSGTYTLDADQQALSFSPLAATKMACPAMQLERKYLQSLQRVSRYRLEGDNLVLLQDNGNPAATFVAVYFR